MDAHYKFFDHLYMFKIFSKQKIWEKTNSHIFKFFHNRLTFKKNVKYFIK